MYIPAFIDHASLLEIEKECFVEFNVNTGPLCMKNVASFSKMVSSKLESPQAAEVSCLDTVLHQKDPEDINTPASIVWSWSDDHHAYTPYDAASCAKISAEYSSSPQGSFELSIATKLGTTAYYIDFASMTQTNIETGHTRTIQKSSDDIAGMRAKINSTRPMIFNLQISGLLPSIQTAEVKLKAELNKTLIKHEEILPGTADNAFQTKVIQSLQNYFVSAEIVGDKVQVQGIRSYTEKVVLILQRMILDHEKKLLPRNVPTPQGTPTPSHWEPQSDQFALNNVSPSSPEWNEIEQKVHKTLPNVRIRSIQRIQNKWLWDRYSFAKQRMFERNGGIVNEKLLFHGTRNTPPEKIYKSEQGFDFRFSSQGMWGTGTYFAVNASYSDSYIYRSCSFSDKQMILASVLTGETYRCDPNSSLKKPPVKPQRSGCFEDERYDSISGYTNRSDVFIIYDHEKAYPSYLITYN